MLLLKGTEVKSRRRESKRDILKVIKKIRDEEDKRYREGIYALRKVYEARAAREEQRMRALVNELQSQLDTTHALLMKSLGKLDS